ncbi:thioesterase II family protein [Kitasatospora sp. NPDC101176]|uniref:thioesterase II family protein n=1 Tax=Kitasatospora sp. NPDC101176 TaxID=3364099 RepID=UPI00380E2BF2
MAETPWGGVSLSGFEVNGATTIRLFGFHHAGGSGTLFHGWQDRLPAGWEVQALDAPGHGSLMGRELIDELDRLVGYFLDQVRPGDDVPYAFFGHSMGGIVAYELARRLVGEGAVPPVWLGISACRAPRSAPPVVLRHTLSEAQLRRHVRELGGTPEQLLDDPRLWEIFGPIIRADLRLVEQWRPAHAEPLPVPLTVFRGRDDALATPGRVAAWEAESTAFRGLRTLDGDHFYFGADPAPLLRHLVEDVRSACTALPHPAR